MLTRRRLFSRGLAAAVAVLCLAPALALAQPDTRAAEDFIRRLGDEAVSLAADGAAPFEQRKERLRGLLGEATDLDLVSRFVLGRYWRTATPEQQQEYQNLFRRWLIEGIASRFGDYGGETFEILQSVPADDRDVLVRTNIVRPNGPPVHVDWRVRQQGGANQIIDVIVEGVSMVATQRSEFGQVVSNRGMEGLLAELRSRVQTGDTEVLPPT
jgi:phospholipid transport system substrate-binding protein